MTITEIPSGLKRPKAVRERMQIFIPEIDEHIPSRNGFVCSLTGSGGSGKSSLLLNMFKSKQYYRGKFDNLFYFTKESSFSSVERHPFQDHDKVYFELSTAKLEEIANELEEIKQQCIDNDVSMEYSCIVIDDMADELRDNVVDAIKSIIKRTRHLCLSWVICSQYIYQLPKLLRRQLTDLVVFRTKNAEEWKIINEEFLQGISKAQSQELFNYCFSEPYNHLRIDNFENKFYKNFNLLQF